MLQKLLCLLLVILSVCCPALGQQVRVIFKATDKDNQPITYAAMQVCSATDSANAHWEENTDSVGKAIFTLVQGQQYVVRLQAMNFKPTKKNILVKGEHPVFTINAEPESKSLSGVEVVAKRPLLRQEDDKTIVDPEELANSSTSAYDIMEKVPGIFVDQDGNIYITSTTPATIYINGREQKMSNSDVAAMLKSLPPNSIDRIEILRTPSAKYDASSSGGIVNVVLKKGVKIGITGNVNTGMNQGTYGNQFAGFTLNNNNGIWSTTFTINTSHNNSGERLKTDRKFGADSMLSQNAYTTKPGNSYSTNYSIGYSPNKKWDITYDGRLNLNNNQSISNSPAIINQVSTGHEAMSYNTGLTNDIHNINISQGLSTKYKPDTLGSEWTTDLSVNIAPNSSTQSYNTNYTLPLAAALNGNGDISTHNRYLSFRSDVTKKMPHKLSVEAGIKLSGVWDDNNTHYTLSYLSQTIEDKKRTNAYYYDEQIYAGYLQASKGFGSILVKAGTRIENTNMTGHQTVPSDTGYQLHRTDLFPYVYISRKLMKIASFELRSYLIYRRTITRPSYDYLNPFPKYVDQYLSDVGNPLLKPQFTNNYEANVSVDERPLFAFGYNDMTDIFSQVIYQADSSHRQTYRTYDNLGSNKEVYLRGLVGIPPGKVYFFIVGAQYNHNIYNGQYNGAPLNYTHESWTFFTYQTVKFSKLTTLVINGFLKYKTQIQFYELSTFGALNLSLNHQFLHKKLKMTISVNDVFETNNNVFTIDQGNIHATGLRKGDTRRFGLNATYNFGIRKKEEHNFLSDTPEENGK